MEPEIRTQKGAVDGAPEIVTGWFMGSVVGYRLMVGWMGATLTVLVGGIWLVCDRLRALTVAVENLK